MRQGVSVCGATNHVTQERTDSNLVSQRKAKKFISATAHIQMIIFSSNVSVQQNVVELSNIHYKADGFFLNHNQYDAIFLDDLTLKDLTASELEELKMRHLYGCVYSEAV